MPKITVDIEWGNEPVWLDLDKVSFVLQDYFKSKSFRVTEHRKVELPEAEEGLKDLIQETEGMGAVPGVIVSVQNQGMKMGWEEAMRYLKCPSKLR